MSLIKKKGRPKLRLVESDKGTQELIAKKALRLTSEPLDICLEKAIINEKEHWAGIHLRWLHSLKFGINNITTRVPYISDFQMRIDEPTWKEQREKEYSLAMAVLTKMKCRNEIINLCIYHRKPRFLLLDVKTAKLKNSLCYDEYKKVKNGLSELAKIWSTGVKIRKGIKL